MISRMEDLCRRLRPVLGGKIDRLWRTWLAESDPAGKADIEQTLELLAAKHLKADYQPDPCPFPPPSKAFACKGDIQLGRVWYADQGRYPFFLQSRRLKEHLLVAGRSGSGKTNLVFILMRGMIDQGIKVLALDWKRGYRDLLSLHPQIQVFTVGRDIAPIRFNPLIPPAGCEPQIWIKLIVDVIAGAYLGGEGVISLLVAGLDHLYSQAGVYEQQDRPWPTVRDLLAWLRTAKLKGRAAMWQASAERILLAMTYGEFGSVLNASDNAHIANLLDHNVILEMDGLSSASDKVMFSEALALYLYRHRLVQGPQEKLTHVMILEEAHNLLLKKSNEARESVLESSIRMIRQYGIGYVFVDQSASLLSKVAFANSYATLALSQKLRSDIQTLASAMNLTDEQKNALSTLPVGTAIVRLADEFPEPFMVKVRRCPIREGSISDAFVRRHMAGCSGHSPARKTLQGSSGVISAVPLPDKEQGKHQIRDEDRKTHPPSPNRSEQEGSLILGIDPPQRNLNPEEIRFLADIGRYALSTTVSRYQRLHLSRRRGNAIRQALLDQGLIEAIRLATRSGQVILYELTAQGRQACRTYDIDTGPDSSASLEHRYWVAQTAHHYEERGYQITLEHPVKGNGSVDILACRPGQRVAIEVETGKSDVKMNLINSQKGDFDRVILVATSPAALAVCQKATEATGGLTNVEVMTWLDIA